MLGKIQSGTVSVGDTIQTLSPNSAVKSKGRITRIFLRQGMDQISIPSAGAGDIISIAGIEATVNDTLCDTSVESAIIGVKVDEPTIAMQFYVNDSPLAGSEGKLLTSQNIRERLAKEVETNVALQVVDCGDTFTVKGRGELQMGGIYI